jgi:YVTN family beta-propeller protein
MQPTSLRPPPLVYSQVHRNVIRRFILPLLVILCLLHAASCAANGPEIQRESGRLYVANLRSSDVSVIDLASQHEVARVPVVNNPHEFATLGNDILVSNYRSTAVTRLTPDGDVIEAVAVPGDPHGLAAIDGFIAVTQGRAGTVSILDMNARMIRSEVAAGVEPHMVAAVDGRLYVTDAGGNALVEIDPALPDSGNSRAAVTRRTGVGGTPEALAISPDGRTIAVANAGTGNLSLVDRATFAERTRIAVPGLPVRTAYSSDGRLLAASLVDAGQVVILDADDGRTLWTVDAGRRPDGLAFSPDGRRLYVALAGEQHVAVISVADRAVSARIAVGDGPSGLLLVP